MDTEKITQELKEKAKKLLLEKKVDCIIGYEERDGVASPYFAESFEDVEQLIFNDKCIHNLTIYLLDSSVKDKKIGVVAKGCDSRAVIELIKQNQIERENIYVIGISCDGIKENDELYEKCKTCRYPNPLIYDVVLGDKIEKINEDNYSDILEIESMSSEEKRKFWEKEFQKCIKCFACRNICPVCCCKDCVLEDENWISKSGDAWMFHLTKAFHTAGRCISCGECERVCPMNIPLTKLYRKIEKEVKEKFDYEAGINVDDALPLTNIESDLKK